MIEIPTNSNVRDTAVEKAIEKVVNTLKTQDFATLVWARDDINRKQAEQIADLFYAKGYHHEIRMHSNDYGRVFFYSLTISKTPVCSNDGRLAWSVYVR